MPTWLPWLLITIAVLSIGFLAWYLMFGGEEEDDDQTEADTLMITAAEGKDPLATTTEEYKSTARKSRMIALKESLERSLDSREGAAQMSAKDRMLMPWFMLVGADGSGKRTILANTGLPLPWGPPLEVDSQRKDAGKWWLFEDAVVLEAPAAAPGTTPGTTTLPPGQTVADTSVGWNTLLHMLRRERPDSPLNGIIVTISCADLMGARVNPDRMEEQADRINNFLAKTRKFLGVRLPLHVLVTKCDTLPGFRSFAEALPDSRRHDIFGWANPNDIEGRFEPGWVDTGFTHLQQQLADLRDEVLAAPEQVRDSVGVFVFDSEFSDLQEPLKAFVARLMTVGERRPSLFFRGFYFTGDSLDTSESASLSDKTLVESHAKPVTRPSSEIAGEAHSLVFLTSLFKDKIFKEAGLARPFARLRLARDRRVVIAQAAALVIALVGGAGLWTSVNGVRRDQTYRPGLKDNAEMLTRVLSGVAIDLDELRRGAGGPQSVLNRRTRDAAVIELVGQMRDVPSMRVRSPFIPSSWFSPLPAEIKESMMMGIQNIVLPVTRQRLEERSQRLLSPPTASDSMMSDVLDPTDPRSLTEYLGEVRALSRNIARYNSLADSTSGSVAELSALLDYLFGEQIATDSALATQDFEEALERAKAPRIVIAPDMAQTVVNRAVRMVATVADRASQQLAPRATPAAERGIRAEDDLDALNGLASLVRLLDPKDGVVAKVTDQPILGIKLARAVEDSIAAQFLRVAAHVVRDTVSPDSSAKRLRNVIERLYQYRLMDRTEARQISSEIRPNERLRWDIGRLELALGLPNEFLQAVVAVAEGFPGQTPDRFRKALEVQLRARALDVAASAQRFTPVPPTADPQLEVRSSGANLDAAAPRLIRLAVLLDTLKAGREGKMLVAAGARQAEHSLAAAQRLYDQRLTYFTPQTAKIATWQGVVPFSFAALGVARDTVEQASKLISHATDVRALGYDVIPAINYLRLPTVRDSVKVPGLLANWEAIVAAFQRYERAEITSTLGMLHRYIKDGLSMSDLTTCTAVASEPDTTKPSTDPFVIRRRQFRAALVSRCGTGGAAEAVANYQRLRTQFQTRLAGRYPFADSTFTGRGEAEPAAVRDFFKQYDTFAIVDDVALRSHPTLSQTAKAAIAFLDQLALVRPFVAPYVDNSAGAIRSSPAFSLMVSAPPPQSDSLPTSTLELQVGARSEPIEETAQERAWRHGDSVKVVLIPLDTSRVRMLFVGGGGWTALRFAQARPANLDVRFYHPDTKLELPVPVFPATAPEILIPRSK